MTRLSIADENRASIKTSRGKGIALSWEVDQIDRAWADAKKSGLEPTEIRKHPWGVRFFIDQVSADRSMWKDKYLNLLNHALTKAHIFT